MHALGISGAITFGIVATCGCFAGVVAWMLGMPPGLSGALGAAVAAWTATVLFWLVAKLRRDCVHPLEAVLRGAEAMRRGGTLDNLPHTGAPIVAAIARSIRQAASTVHTREQLSQANLMSIEAAFERVHSVLQSLNEGVLVIDGDHRILLANPSARRQVIAQEAGIEGCRIGDAGDPEFVAILTEMFGEREGKDINTRVEYAAVELGERIFDLSVAPFAANGRTLDSGFVVVLVDVTRNQEISRLKDQFLSTVSHELRTPLTNICAFSEILTQVGPDSGDEWKEFVEIVSGEGDRMSRLVDDVLDYTRLEQADVELVPEPVDLVELAGVVWSSLAPAAKAKNLEFSCEASSDRVLAFVDHSRTSQVMARLLDNAVKFTPEGGRVHVAITHHDHDFVELAVEDSGPGVHHENREAVFEKFQQLSDHMVDKPDGTGLGLAICRRSVDLQGGTLWCDESPLGGAMFRMLVPAVTVDYQWNLSKSNEGQTT